VKAENEAVSDSFLKNILLGDDFFFVGFVSLQGAICLQHPS
jgi:hypothetical protein